jgi:hypothetical protein
LRVEEEKLIKNKQTPSCKSKKAFNQIVKHSKKEKKPDGFSKGGNHDRKCLGPAMMEDVLEKQPAFCKNDLDIHEMIMGTH